MKDIKQTNYLITKGIILLIGIIIVNFGCKTNENIFSKVDFNSNGYKLYFINSVNLAEQHFNECDYQNTHSIFYIDDNFFLKKLQQEYISETENDIFPNQTRCFYVLQLVKNKKLVWGGFVDWNNRILKSSKDRYQINIEKLTNDSLKFKKASCFKIKIQELSNARKFYTLLIENGAFIYGLQFLKENPLFIYNGEILLKTDTTKLSMKRKGSEIEKDILNDFKGLGKIRVTNIHSEISDVDIKITIQSEQNIDNLIPSRYIITKTYKPIEDIDLIAIDIDEQKINQIIEINKLNGITYKKI